MSEYNGYTIDINPAVLESVAREVGIIAADLYSQGKKMKRVVSDVEDAWQSDYTDMYTSNIYTVKAETEATAEGLENVADSLRRIAERVRELERELARRAQEAAER